jgi:hypothetical protein
MKRTQMLVAAPLPLPVNQPSSSSSMHPGSSSPPPDLLWISKHQQQHPSTHAHPLKNTIRVNSSGTRYKFDGKQWRPLCESPDGFECRNLAFRSSLCQKHFYKSHNFKRPYMKNGSVQAQTPLSLKRPISNSYEHPHHHHHPHLSHEHDDIENEQEMMYEDDNSIQVLENSDVRQYLI